MECYVLLACDVILNYLTEDQQGALFLKRDTKTIGKVFLRNFDFLNRKTRILKIILPK